MVKRRTRLVQHILLITLLIVLDLGVINAHLSRHTEPQVIVIHEDPALATYRYEVARSMGILMNSGCFRPSDACLDHANEMIMYTEDGLTLEAYRQYLAEGISHLWETKCVEHVEGCGDYAFGLLRSLDTEEAR